MGLLPSEISAMTDQVSGGFTIGKFGIQIIVVVLALGAWWFWLTYKYGAGTKSVRVFLDHLINNVRVFDKEYAGKIKKKEKDDREQKLFIAKLSNFWGQIPDPKFFSHDKRGNLILRGVHDGQGFINWIVSDSTVFIENEKIISEPVLNEEGKPIYDDIEVKDDNGNNIIIDKATGLRVMLDDDEKHYDLIDKKGKVKFRIPIDQKREYVVKTEKVAKMLQKKEYVREPSPREQVLESDVKLYFINKSQELEQRFKKKDENAWIKQAVAIGMVVMLILVVGWMSYKHIEKNIEITAGKMETTADKYINFFEKTTGLNKEKDENFGKPVDG